MDKVSIVIPAYNASDYLAQAIDSALAQTYSNVEVVVINDGSPDNGETERIALSYGDKIKYYYKENGGSSSALNLGIEKMTGEWFSWLSHDDLYTPEKVEKQMSFIRKLGLSDEEKKDHIFFSASDLIDADGKTIRHADIEKAEATHAMLEGLTSNESMICEPTQYNFHGCSCLIHKSAFERVGSFDEKLRLLNDVDMWFRLYSSEFRVHYIPLPLVKGRVHAKQVSRSIGYSYHNSEQDMFWTRSLDWLKRNHPQDFSLYYKFGRNAYLKTRNTDGDAAFEYAFSLNKKSRIKLKIKKIKYKFTARLRSIAKQIYLKLEV